MDEQINQQIDGDLMDGWRPGRWKDVGSASALFHSCRLQSSINRSVNFPGCQTE